jgi:tetratricopeptide (TPR) repeat protein
VPRSNHTEWAAVRSVSITMSHKRKRRKHRSAQAGQPAVLSSQAMAHKAQAELTAGHYREAIELFKALLKQELRPEWVDALAQAYQGRAVGLADKGMFKEAIVFWQNRTELCHRPLAEPFYFCLLFQTGRVAEAVRLFREQQALLETSGSLMELRVQFAAQALAGRAEVTAGLAPEDPVVVDYPAAIAAVQAYCRGDDAALEAQLQRIPFRSPYRDLRQALKALSLQERGDPRGALQLLDRVPATSPFAALRTAARAAMGSGPARYRQLQQLSPEARRFAAALQGGSSVQLAVGQELMQLGETPEPEGLLRFLLRHRQTLGDAYVQKAAMSILVVHSAGRHAYAKAFGALSPFHSSRIEALRAEKKQDPYTFYESWMKVVRLLEQGDVHPGTEEALCAALILRRVGEHCGRFEPLAKAAVEALERSLDLDPDDLPTYLKLLRHYREHRRLQDARGLLDKALARYPEALEVLLEAVEIAAQSKSFKKAAGLARHILTIDPINSKVRNILVDLHLAHARKQIQQEKWALAHKELEEAGQWAQTEQAQGRIDLVWGFLALAAGEADTAARDWFREGSTRLGGALVGRLYLLLEAVRLEQPLTATLKHAALPDLPKPLERTSILALIHALQALRNEDPKVLGAAVNPLKTALESAAALPFSHPETELICETFRHLGQHFLRSCYARAALQRWPEVPVFVYHLVDADYAAGRTILSYRDIERLENALDRARKQGDMRTSHHIVQLLTGDMPLGTPAPLPLPKGDTALSEDLAEMVEDLGIDRVIEMMLEQGPPAEVKELKAEIGAEGLRRVLEAIIRGSLTPDLMDEMIEEDHPLPFGRKRTKKRTKAR